MLLECIFFGTRKTLRIWLFVSRMLPLTPTADRPNHGPNHGQEHREKRRTRSRSEMLTWTTSKGEVSFDVVVDAGKMQQCLRDRCRLNKCFKPSSNHKPNIFQSQVQTYLQKMTKL